MIQPDPQLVLPPQVKDVRILVTGASGLVGSAIVKLLQAQGHTQLLTPTSRQLNLLDPASVEAWFAANKPQIVLMVAARVGGIKANKSHPVEFTRDNLLMEINLFDVCLRHKTLVNVFMGSSCIYPRLSPQPMREEYLQTGPLEPTNEGYALAKLVGLRMADFYLKQHGMRTLCPLPCNIYGANDTFDLEKAHVLSSLVRRFVDAKDQNLPHVTLWGTGTPRRELIHADDVARATLFLLNRHFSADGPIDARPINVGTGVDHSILQIAHLVSQAVGYTGQIKWDTSMPDGMPVKLLDVSTLKQWGFSPRITLEEGIRQTILSYRETLAKGPAPK